MPYFLFGLQVLEELSLKSVIGVITATETPPHHQFAHLPPSLHAAVTHGTFPSLRTESCLRVRFDHMSNSALTYALQSVADDVHLGSLRLSSGVLPDAQGFASDIMTPLQQQQYQQKHGLLKAAIEVHVSKSLVLGLVAVFSMNACWGNVDPSCNARHFVSKLNFGVVAGPFVF